MAKLLLSSIVALALISPTLFAADEPATKAAAKKAAADKTDGAEALKGRLPNGYAKIVDTTQRQKIYAIQTQYVKEIDDLKKKLLDLEAKRDAEIRAVLTDKQQKELDAALGDTAKATKAKKAAK